MEMTLGHVFNKTKASTGEPRCGVCGLVWKSKDFLPAMNCPRQPLGSINVEWVERYT